MWRVRLGAWRSRGQEPRIARRREGWPDGLAIARRRRSADQAEHDYDAPSAAKSGHAVHSKEKRVPFWDCGRQDDDAGLWAVPGHNFRIPLVPADLLDLKPAGGVRHKCCRPHAQLCQPLSHGVNLGPVIDIEAQRAVGVLGHGHHRRLRRTKPRLPFDREGAVGSTIPLLSGGTIALSRQGCCCFERRACSSWAAQGLDLEPHHSRRDATRRPLPRAVASPGQADVAGCSR
jgi:hypothetical protein